MMLLGAILLSAGCASPYKPHSFSGGFSDLKLSEDTWVVTYAGNGYTSSARSGDFTLLRAAELVHQAGYPYFTIMNAEEGFARMVTKTEGTAKTTSTVRPTGFNNYQVESQTTYTPPKENVILKPHARMFVKGLHDRPDGIVALEAVLIIQQLKAKYGLD